MSDLCSSFSNLLLLFFSFILSHPLYFSYFIFFSPYLLNLLSFLSPLFITTSLVLVGFLTLSPGFVHESSSLELSEYQVAFLLSTYHAVTERLRSKTDDKDDEFLHSEDLEAYKIVFDTSTFYTREDTSGVPELRSEENNFQALEAPVLDSSIHEISGISMSEIADFEERAVEIAWEETTQPSVEGDKLEGFIKELDELENITTFDEEEKKVEQPGVNSEKVSLARSGFEVLGDKIKYVTVKVPTDNGGDYASKVADNSHRLDANVNSTDHGGENTSKFFESSNLRKEKEWKRTLACRLFEERHNVGGVEGMDLLWETYEMDSSDKAKPKGNTKTKKNRKKSDFEGYGDDDREEEDINGQLCCLQALKFSAGKMNLGMGRPNLVKISKAIKGIGWLHHVTRHGRKKGTTGIDLP